MSTLGPQFVDWSETQHHRVPSLILPFGLVGLVAGWLSGRVIGGPLFDGAVVIGGPLFDGAVVGEVPKWAALCGALLGTVAGAILWLRCKDDLTPSMRRKPLPKIPLPLVVLAAGALSGAAVDQIVPYSEFFETVGLGLLCSIPFIPVAAFVVAAARRAARARHGSLVAGSDRRAVWSALAVTLAVTTLGSLPEWSSELFLKYSGPPIMAALASVTAASLIVAVLLLDLFAWRRLSALLRTGATMEARAPEEVRDREALPSVDLGLGDDLRAEVAHGSAYRHVGRVTSLLIGDADEARGVMRRATLRGLASTLVAAVVVSVHVLAAH